MGRRSPARPAFIRETPELTGSAVGPMNGARARGARRKTVEMVPLGRGAEGAVWDG
jgi:hypothetical protein